MPDVRVILTNWRRPKNLIPIAKAFREQSVPVEIVVVDNSGGKKFALSDEVRDTVDDVITFGDNAGPACRFIGGFFAKTTYVQFHDDDALPGRRCVECYLECAAKVKDNFGILGFLGRKARWREFLNADGKDRTPEYKRHNVMPKRYKFDSVDFTCRGMFVRQSSLWAYERFRERLRAAYPRKVADRMAWEDDIMLALGVKLELGLPVLLRPAMPQNRSPLMKELPFARAQSGRQDHDKVRENLIMAAYNMGWRGWWSEENRNPIDD